MINYSVFMLAFAASAAAPGPEIAALVSRVLAGGMRSSFALAAGIVIGKLLMLTTALLGLAALYSVLGPWFAGLKFLGAAYLLYVGIRKWRAAGRVLAAGGSPGGLNPASETLLGLAMTLSNPVAIMFYLALLPGAVDMQKVDLQVFVFLCSIITGIMATVVLVYGSLAELARKLFSSPGSKAGMDRAAAAMMLGAALVIACR